MSIFTWLLAVLATAMLLPKDIEDRTLYTILAKPVPRFEYLLGKFLGVLLLLFIALSLMSVVFVDRALHARAGRARRSGQSRDSRPSMLAARAAADPREHFQPQPAPGHRHHLPEGRALRRAHAAALDLRLVVDFHDHRLGRCLSHRPRAADRPRGLSGLARPCRAADEGLPRAGRRSSSPISRRSTSWTTSSWAMRCRCCSS